MAKLTPEEREALLYIVRTCSGAISYRGRSGFEDFDMLRKLQEKGMLQPGGLILTTAAQDLINLRDD